MGFMEGVNNNDDDDVVVDVVDVDVVDDGAK